MPDGAFKLHLGCGAKIIPGYVNVDILEAPSINAVCEVKGQGSMLTPREDLAAWMLRNGWAVALPDAPFEYHVFEDIARTHKRGIWGFQVDHVH